MASYNYYPTYQPFGFPAYPQPVPQSVPSVSAQQAVPQPTMNQSGVIWVQNEDAPKNYPVAPGSSAVFMSENTPYLFIKTADAVGKPTMKKYRLTEETDSVKETVPHETEQMNSDYVRRDEIEQLVIDTTRSEVNRRFSEYKDKNKKHRGND